MKSVRSISVMKPKDTGILVSVKCKSSMYKRLMEIGFVEGTKISCVLESPLKDPLAFLINGTVIALRKKDCSLIMVEDVKEENYGID